MYGICKICGCTDNNACVSGIEGPCYWIDKEHTLCSSCRLWKDTDVSGYPKVQHQVTVQGESYSDGKDVRVITGWDDASVYFIENPVIGTYLHDYKQDQCSREEFEGWAQHARIYRGESDI